MLEFLTSDAFLILFGTLFGGVGLKVVEKWINRGAEKRVERSEFLNEVKELNARIDTLEQEIDDWRIRFYKMQDEYQALRQFVIKYHGPDQLPPPIHKDQHG